MDLSSGGIVAALNQRRGQWRLAVLAGLALIVTAIVLPLQTGAAGALTGKIVYSTGGNLYVIAGDGSAPQRIWTAPAGKAGIGPRWSPDGSEIAFEGPDGNIWVMDADGSRARALIAQAVAPSSCAEDGCSDPGAVTDSPRWSPDSSSISYRLVEGLARASVWTVTARGTTTPQRIAAAADLCLFNEGWTPAGVPLYSRCAGDSGPSNATYTSTVGSVQQPVLAGSQIAYSADGVRVAFSSHAIANGVLTVNLFVANADGSGAQRVAAGGQNPAWSRSGLLAYRIGTRDGWEIHVLDPASGRDHNLGDGVVIGWSPDGSWLLFTTQNQAGVTSILRVRPDGSDAQLIASGDFPDWSA